MRVSLLAPLLISTLLAACAFKGEIPPSKHISPSGPLKVHPGLLGNSASADPLPAIGQPAASPAATQTETVATSASADAPIRMDSIGLRTQRSVYFDLNSASIKADYDPALRAHARYLADNPKARVRIEGNADERGTPEYNHRLGMKRADKVRFTLLSHGAGKKQLSIKTLGAGNPKKTGHDEESWADNRRSDVVYEREL